MGLSKSSASLFSRQAGDMTTQAPSLLALLPTPAISLDMAHQPEGTDLIPELLPSSCSMNNFSSLGAAKSCV